MRRLPTRPRRGRPRTSSLACSRGDALYNVPGPCPVDERSASDQHFGFYIKVPRGTTRLNASATWTSTSDIYFSLGAPDENGPATYATGSAPPLNLTVDNGVRQGDWYVYIANDYAGGPFEWRIAITWYTPSPINEQATISEKVRC